MNKTEARYAERLRMMECAGEIEGFEFEAVKLKLANLTTYTPDFVVYGKDGVLEFHEVKAATRKGRILIEDDAAVKIKVAADKFPFRFILVYEQAGQWVRKDYTNT